jgi:hypothetical protein
VTGARLAQAARFAGLSQPTTVCETVATMREMVHVPPPPGKKMRETAEEGALQRPQLRPPSVRPPAPFSTIPVEMKRSAGEPRCQARNARGEPCAATIIGPDGYCPAHGGKLDMKAIGVKGGKASVRSRLGLGDDLPDALRGKARKRLDAALDDPDPKIRLAAARAIASYSPERPPLEAAAPEQQHTGRGCFRLVDIFAVMCERRILSQVIDIDESLEADLAQRFRERGILDDEEEVRAPAGAGAGR